MTPDDERRGSAARKSRAGTSGRKKPASKKPAAKKPAPKKRAAKKSPARKSPARKRATGKAPETPAAFVEPSVGSRIASYVIEAPIGRGGMGVLFRAEDERAATRGRRVALKVLPPSLAADERFRQRFERESQMAASLDHPNIVPVFEAGEDQGVLYIAMRYVEGEDLHAFLSRTGPLEADLAVSIVAQVGSALDAAHGRGLVHRDVKPANVLVVGGGAGTPHVYLTDFGVTKRTTSRSGLTATGQFVGTVEYVAPEQIEGRAVDGRADVYSLGCVLFECLTGAPPFGGEQEAATLWAHLSEPSPAATSRRPGLPSEIDAVIERALAKSPEERYATCGELVDAARTALAAPPTPLPPRPAAAPTPAPAPTPIRAPAPPAPHAPPAPAAAPVATPPAGYGRPPPRPGLSTGVIVAIAAGAVALIALVALIVALAGGGPSGPQQRTDAFPNEAERRLLERIPQALRSPPCTRGSTPAPGASATVDCFTDTPQLTTFALFPDVGSMNAAYRQRVTDSGVPEETGNCADGEPAEDSWVDPEGTQSGRLLCFTGPAGSPTIVWTHDEELILGEASRPGGDAVALYEFWTGIADYSTVEQPSG